ncbi:MAG: HlyD family efflux transporter periplasmic adaptor subunit [Pirellula sp.]
MQNTTFSPPAQERASPPLSVPLRALLKRCYSSPSPTAALSTLVEGFRCLVDADRIVLMQCHAGSVTQEAAVSGGAALPTHSELLNDWRDLAQALGSSSSNEDRNRLLFEHSTKHAVATTIAIPLTHGQRTQPGQHGLAGAMAPESTGQSTGQSANAAETIEPASMMGLLIVEWATEARAKAQSAVLDASTPWIKDACEVLLQKPHGRARAIGWSRWWRWAAFGIFAGWMLMPIEMWIEVDGALQPTVQRFVFAPCDGYVDAFLVRDGAELREGETMIRINSPEMRLQRLQFESELRVVEEKRIGLEAAANQISNREESAAVLASRMAGELEELKKKKESLESQLRWLGEEESRLTLRAAISGVVVADPQWQESQDRPVRRGELLARIVGTQADWQVEGHVLDWESGYITQAFARSQEQGESIPVEMILASAPRTTIRGTLVQLDRAFRHETVGPSLDVRVNPDGPLKDPRVGATAKLRIPCGRWMRCSVWTRTLLDSIYRRFWL